MVSSLIEVFVCSHDRDVDIGHYREMSLHSYCDSSLAQWAYGELAAQFKGRILSEDDLAVLRRVCEMAKKENQQIKVYDTSRLSDKIKAVKRGILRTPAIVLNGKRFEGLDEISAVLGVQSL